MYQQQRLAHYQLAIRKVEEEGSISLGEKEIEGSLKALMELVEQRQGYSPYLFIYRGQLSPFNALPFLNVSSKIQDILSQFPQIFFTHHNPQFVQQQNHLIASPPPTKQQKTKTVDVGCMFVIIQSYQGPFFYNQTFKLSLDCKILFLTSLASRYGRNPSLLYFDFKLPLSLFDNSESIQSALLQYSFVQQHLIIIVERGDNQEDVFFKTVKNKNIINHQKYFTIAMEDQHNYLIVDNRADWRVVGEILELVLHSNVEVRDQEGQHHSIKSLEQMKNMDLLLLTIVRKQINRYYLPKPLRKSLFIGQTQHFLCFVQRSSILHIFSLAPPFQLINSTLLSSKQDEQLQQELPILKNQTLIMYNITKTAIALKYYSLPQTILTKTKHFKWRHEQYGNIQCQTLDLLAVHLKKNNSLRVFFIDNPNSFMDIQKISKTQKLWVAREGKNSHSDSSGIFALEHVGQSQIHVYDLHCKSRIDTLELPSLKNLVFHTSTNRLIAQIEHKCIEYDYKKKWIISQYSLSKDNEQLYYTPKGQMLILTPSSIRNPNQKDLNRLGNCLLQFESHFFSKDQPMLLNTYEYIHLFDHKKINLTADHSPQISTN